MAFTRQAATSGTLAVAVGEQVSLPLASANGEEAGKISAALAQIDKAVFG